VSPRSATGHSTDTDREHEDKGEDGRGHAAPAGRAASSGVKGKDAGSKEAGKRKGRSDTEGDESEPAKKRPAKTQRKGEKQRRKDKPVVVEDSDEEVKKSRYRPVTASSLFNAWSNEVLDPIRKEFQLAVLARDGFPAKVAALDRAKNLMQLLASAKKVLDKQMFSKFKGQVEAAYADPSKE
jgi:hypothetical protein